MNIIQAYWFSIVAKWKEVGWVPPLPTLDRHLEHILGGMAFAWIALQFGVEPLGCCFFSTAVSLLIEGLTALSKGNWKDSTCDFLQYQLVWVVYCLPDFGLFFGALAVYLIVYFALLLRGW